MYQAGSGLSGLIFSSIPFIGLVHVHNSRLSFAKRNPRKENQQKAYECTTMIGSPFVQGLNNTQQLNSKLKDTT